MTRLTKHCSYCKTDTHSDAECWSTRPADWEPTAAIIPVSNTAAIPPAEVGTLKELTDALRQAGLGKLIGD